MGRHTGFYKTVTATVDRIEDGAIVLVAHRDPVMEFSLPTDLFPGFCEGDVVTLSATRVVDAREEREQEIQALRRKLKSVDL